MLRFPEGQVGKAWEFSKKAVLFRISGNNGWKSAFPFFVFRSHIWERNPFVPTKQGPPQPPMIVCFTERTPTSGMHLACRMPYMFDFVTE